MRTARALVAALVALGVTTPHGFAVPRAETRHVAASAAAVGDVSPIYWGALVRGRHYGLREPPEDMTAVAAFESHTGKGASILHFGDAWFSNGRANPFPRQLFDNVRLHGSIPLYSWSSRDRGGPNLPAFRNSVIASGAYDDYIRQFAADARDWGHPLFLRLDWEMNGWWYPWAEGSPGVGGAITNGNAAGDFVRMWRHVHDIFREVGATNVTWVWCVNQMSRTSTGSHPPMEQIYPGDDYVDWTAVDVYNRYKGWESLYTAITGAGTDWLLDTYAATSKIAPSKPMMLAEFGSKESPGDPGRKATWITDALRREIPTRLPAIKAIVYFNWNVTDDPSNPDSSVWIESSPQAQEAFAAGIRSPYYAANTFAALPPGKIPVPTPVRAQVDTPVRRSIVARDGLRIAVRCVATCRVTTRVTIGRRAARMLGIRSGSAAVLIGRSSGARIPAGEIRRLRVRLERRAAAALARSGRRVRLAVSITTTPGGTHTRHVTLKRSRR